MSLFTKKILSFILSTSLLLADSLPTTLELFNPSHSVYDVVPDGEPTSTQTMLLVDKILVEVEAISGLMPREFNIANCSATGCPIDSAMCDAIAEVPYCPDGGTLNTERDMCQKAPTIVCGDGYVFDDLLDTCVRQIDCPDGGVYNAETKRCENSTVPSCEAGYVYDASADKCWKPVDCGEGTFVPARNQCEMAPTPVCDGNGWTYRASDNKCWKLPSCPGGSVYSKVFNACINPYSKTCGAGFVFNATRNRCEKAPECPSGTTYNATTDRCEGGANSACSGGTWNGSSCTVSTQTLSSATSVIYSTGLLLAKSTTLTESTNQYIYNYFKRPSDNYQYPANFIILKYDKNGDGCPKVTNSCWSDIQSTKNTTNNGCIYTGLCGSTVFTANFTLLASVTNTFNVDASCPSGQTNDNGRCVANPTCTNSTYDGDADVCYQNYTKTCPSGQNYNAELDACAPPPVKECVSGYSYVAARDRCEKTPDCPSGTTFNATLGKCTAGANSACAYDGGTWNGSTCTKNVTVLKPGYGQAGNGLYYDGCQGGSRTWPSAEEYCSSKGMRLPSASEARGWSSSGVPSCSSWTWAIRDFGIIGYSIWQGTSNSYNNSSVSHQVRCVTENASIATATSTQTFSPSCPSGQTNHNGQCIANPTCPNGGSYDNTQKVCYQNFSYNCGANMLDPATNMCVIPANCDGGVLDVVEDLCLKTFNPVCDAGWVWNNSLNACTRTPECAIGTYSATYKKCIRNYANTCPSGYTYNSSRDQCERAPVCPSGTTYNVTTNRCEGTFEVPNQNTTTQWAWWEQAWNEGWCYIGCAPDSMSGERLIGEWTFMARYALEMSVCYDYGYEDRVTPEGRIERRDYRSGPGCINTKTVYSNYRIINNGPINNGYVHRVIHINSPWPPDYYKIVAKKTTNYGECLAPLTEGTSSATCTKKEEHNPTCPSGGTLNGTIDQCVIAKSKTCSDAGFIYDSVSDKCIKDPNCWDGALNASANLCAKSYQIDCPPNWTKQPATGACFLSIECENGVYDPVAKECRSTIGQDCGTYTSVSGTLCAKDVVCPKPPAVYPLRDTARFSTLLDICLLDAHINCGNFYTYSKYPLSICEAVPICQNGIYNPENDFCYIDTQPCPISPDLACNGPIGNKWCSPYSCNPHTNQCGFAKCSPSNPSSTTEMPNDILFGLIQRPQDAVCQDLTCYISDVTRFAFCGTDAACPQGFGVFAQNGNCYKEICPPDTEEMNGECYKLGEAQ